MGTSDADTFVDLDAAPFERFEDIILGARHETLRIGVLDTEDHRAFVPAGEQVIIQCRADAPDVQGPGGTGCEPHPNGSFHGYIVCF